MPLDEIHASFVALVIVLAAFEPVKLLDDFEKAAHQFLLRLQNLYNCPHVLVAVLGSNRVQIG